MRVLYWTELFWPHIGGIELRAIKFLPSMRERGYEFAAVTSHTDLDLPDEDHYNDIPVYRFHFRTALLKRNLKQVIAVRRQVAKLKQTFKPDVVHINFSGPSPLFHFHTAATHPCPTLLSIRILPGHTSGHNSLLAEMLRSADWVTSVSAAMLNDVRQLVPEIIPRSSVIYNGLDMPTLEPEPLSFDAPQLLCLGRIVAQKGFDVALRTVASIVDRFPNLRLIVAGDGPGLPELKQQAGELGLSQVVEFAGWVEPDEVPALMNRATVVLVPSRNEGLPSVAVEAAQMVRPVVATRVVGVPEVITHQQTGMLVEPEDSAALAEAITFLLEHPETTTQMGQAARSRVREMFSMETNLNAYDALYRKLMQESCSD